MGLNAYTAMAKDNLSRGDTNVITATLAANVVLACDARGNLSTNGSRVLEWDDENELACTWVSGVSSNFFAYDGKMRRRITRDYTWNGSAWVLAREVRYVYDGNLVIQERDQFNVPQLCYTRGKDLSGSLQGAGGIGGLLALSTVATLSPQHYYYHADGNGNVTALLSTNQQIVARYLYDPFGNTLSASGPMADVNLYRFSSKELHPASGLVYYLYRFYDPNLQRWPNRDPIAENGGINLFEFASNDLLNQIDPLGAAPAGAQPIPNPPQIPLPKPFPTGPFEYPPAGTGGTSGGNLPPAFPIPPAEKCYKAGKVRNQKGPYNAGSCPCTQASITCTDYDLCEFVGTAGTQGTTGGLGWVPHHDCTKCPEGNYPPNK